MKNVLVYLASIVLLCFSLSDANRTIAQTLYTAVDIGPGTGGTAINNAGVVVGSISQNGNAYPFSYQNGQLSTMQVPGLSGYTGATAINDLGVIVGAGFANPNTYSQPYNSFIYDNGLYTIISNPGGTTAAQGVNHLGVVAGGYALNYGNYFWDPFTFENGTFSSLGAFDPSWVTYALAINDAGVIVGYHSDPDTNQGDHPFSYFNGVYTDLGTLNGGNQASANAINNSGIIVGWSNTGSGEIHAFSYVNGQMTDLGTLGGDHSSANGVNIDGVVVGYSTTSTSDLHAFVYANGAMVDLNSVLTQAIGTTLQSATAINDHGQIVANGSNGDAYLLNPSQSSILNSITVNPANPILVEGQTQVFTAIGNYNDGSSRLLESGVQWASSDPCAATIDASGNVSAVRDGIITISATYGGVTGSALVTVQDSALLAANAQIAQLQAQLASDAVTIQNLQNQVSTLTVGLNNDLGIVTQVLQNVFGDSQFQIPGNTPLDKLQNLVNAIQSLNKGQALAIYRYLGGNPGH